LAASKFRKIAWLPTVAVDCIASNYWDKHKRKMATRGNY